MLCNTDDCDGAVLVVLLRPTFSGLPCCCKSCCCCTSSRTAAMTRLTTLPIAGSRNPPTEWSSLPNDRNTPSNWAGCFHRVSPMRARNSATVLDVTNRRSPDDWDDRRPRRSSVSNRSNKAACLEPCGNHRRGSDGGVVATDVMVDISVVSSRSVECNVCVCVVVVVPQVCVMHTSGRLGSFRCCTSSRRPSKR